MSARRNLTGRIQPRLLVVSPVRDEARHLAAAIAGVRAQTRQPDLWVIIDDGSTDETLAIAQAHAKDLPFLRVLSVSRRPSDGGEGLARGSESRAFNLALSTVEINSFTHVAKLDGDMVLPPEYFEEVLARFGEDPSLGIGGGVFAELRRGAWRRVVEPADHVPGALKTYRRECLIGIGSLEEGLGWDTVDEVRAQARGYSTRAFPELVGHHLRPCGRREGRLAGHARYGRAAWSLGYGLPWVTARGLKLSLARPFDPIGAAYMVGYLRARRSGAEQFPDVPPRRLRDKLHEKARRSPDAARATLA